MTYLECRHAGRKLWIGPFAKSVDAKAWLRAQQLKFRLHSIQQYESRAKVLYAAYELGDRTRCVGVFEDNRNALAAAGRNGVVIDWRASDSLAPEDSQALLIAAPDPRQELEQRAERSG
jgi:hypothetical protein